MCLTYYSLCYFFHGINESFATWKVLSVDLHVSVFRDDSVEPYVPSVLNGNSIERFPRHRERAVKHL